MVTPKFTQEHTALLVVDVQEKLLGHMHNADALTGQLGRLLDGANVLGLPVLVTEQYRKGLGRTVPELADRLQAAVCVCEKLVFSACIEPVRDMLVKLDCRGVLVCGIEAHVCVLQTCLDLVDQGFFASVVVDAIGSRRATDQGPAVQRMVQAGVIPTTVESALLEIVHEAGSERFKAILPIVR